MPVGGAGGARVSRMRRIFAEYRRADIDRAVTALLSLGAAHAIVPICAHAHEIGLDPRAFDSDTARALASLGPTSTAGPPSGTVWFVIANNALRRSIG